MNTNRIIMLFIALLTITVDLAPLLAQAPTPPPTRREDFTETLHGVTIPDPYRWLEDQNSPETRAWIDSQNNYAHSFLDSLPGREKLRKRLYELDNVEWTTVPAERNGRLFYYKRRPDQEQWVIYFRDSEHGREQVLIDPNAMSADHSTNLAMEDISKDGKILAYGIRSGGTDESEIRLFDVDSRRDLADRLPRRLYLDVSLLPDGTGFYYSVMTDDGPRVRFHKIGTDVDSDVEVFGKGYGKECGISATPTRDGRHLLLLVDYGPTTEIWVQDLAHHGPIQLLVKDIDAQFWPWAAGDRLFLQTDWKAPNGRVLTTDFSTIDAGRSTPEEWQELIPESRETIQQVRPAGGKIIVNYSQNASTHIKLFSGDGHPAGEFRLPTLGSAYISHTHWDTDTAFVEYESYTVQPIVYRFNVQTNKRSIWTRRKAPMDSSKFQVEQVWFASKDGTKVPMFLVHRRSIKLNGSNPVLLDGYGGFDANIAPSFNSSMVAWLEHGGIYGLVNLRGDGELGEDWHRAGMLGKKQNVFDDFIAASEWLIHKGYTQPAKLAITGASNGGLLMGAVLTQRPDLFRAVICSYPLLDMLRYDQFFEGAFWISEYGSAKDPEQFKWLYAYSPYHHVKPGVKYPAVLFITGDADTRVAPLHARKMTAALQSVGDSKGPILLRYETKSGHSGGQSLTSQILEETDTFSFLFSQLGIKP